MGEPAKWHKRTVAIKSFGILLREAHPSEAVVDNRQSGPDLAVAGDFGQAAALSLFSAPLRSSVFFGLRRVAPGLCV